MAHQSPPGKTAPPSWLDRWYERDVSEKGVRFGGVWFKGEALRPWEGLKVEVRPVLVNVLQVRLPGSEDRTEWGLIDATVFEDPEAVDAFLSLRDSMPRPPYKPFFSSVSKSERGGKTLPPFPYHGQSRVEECRVTRSGVVFDSVTYFDAGLLPMVGERVLVARLAKGTVVAFTVDRKPICEARATEFGGELLSAGGDHA